MTQHSRGRDHPANEPEEQLLAECRIERTRRSGPGGQHRNKVESAIVIVHQPSGIRAEANERRSQHENRHVAIRRLRLLLAIQVRRPIAIGDGPDTLWKQRASGRQIRVGRDHEDFPSVLAMALDSISHFGWKPSDAAAWLEVSTSQLIRLVKVESAAFQLVNRHRAQLGMSQLK